MKPFSQFAHLWFQSEIKKYLKSEKSMYISEEGEHLGSLLAEFYIWPEMQLHIAMEALYSQGGNDKEFKNKSISEKIVDLRAFLDKLEVSI